MNDHRSLCLRLQVRNDIWVINFYDEMHSTATLLGTLLKLRCEI